MIIRDELLTAQQAATLLECEPGDVAWLAANFQLGSEWVSREPCAERSVPYFSRGEIERRRSPLIRCVRNRAEPPALTGVRAALSHEMGCILIYAPLWEPLRGG